jgi:hypothetical protein
VIGDCVNRQQSGPEQLGVGATERGPLQGFEPIDLAFRLPVAPTLADRIADRLDVDHHGPLEVRDSRNAAVRGVVEPAVERGFVVASQQVSKAEGEMPYRGKGKARHVLFEDREDADLALGQLPPRPFEVVPEIRTGV